MRGAFALALCFFAFPLSALAQDTLAPDVADELNLDTVVGGFTAPTAAEFLPDGRLVVVEQTTGAIKLWDGQTPPRTLGTISVQVGFERGLLGLAIDPEFASTRRLYLFYSQDGSQKVGWVQLDATSDEIMGPPTAILEGMGAGRNHNGGGIAFGPDGLLYIGVGDTGCNCNCGPGQNTTNYYGTCLSNFQGKILRIDRDGQTPATNPLVGVDGPLCTGADCRFGGNRFPTETGPAAPEVYNWGFRNPWRFSFDEQTGFLWIGDVGEISWEEVTISTGPGQHHGWPFREGAHGQAVSRCGEVTTMSGACRDPAFEYPRQESPSPTRASITGGVFSNHCSWPAPWNGRYWFGDFVKARVWTVTPNAARDGVDGERTVVVQGASGPVHFFAGPNGGIYYVAASGGNIVRITPQNPLDCGIPDAGVVDTGVVMDATAPSPDAETVDQGSTEPAPETDDCSCRATRVDPNETPSLVAIGVVLMLIARRWRRRGLFRFA